MKAFTEHVNARLPVDKPDPVLLALLQSHQGRACTASCGEGQTLLADGRCVSEPPVARPRPEAAEPQSAKAAVAPIVVPAPVAAVRPQTPAPASDEPRLTAPPRLVKSVPPPARLEPDATRTPAPPVPARPAEREKSAARDGAPVPEAGMRGGRARNSARSTSYRQIRYAKSLFRSLKRAASSALPFP
jgi:hypothetical protein